MEPPAEGGNAVRAAFYTFGCKVNQYETRCLMDAFSAAGYEVFAGAKVQQGECDVYIVNSCTVTAEGDAKVRKLLRRLRREHPGALLALTGCYAQAFSEIASLVPEADVITGSYNRASLLPAVTEALQERRRVVRVTPHTPSEPFERMNVRSFYGRTRAFIKIQDGCERGCAYCIIPKARGPFRSKPLSELKQEVEGLAAAGFLEIVLTGINLPAYGEESGLRLRDAVQTAASVPGIRRIRLSSLEPERLDEADIALFSSLSQFCPHFHLSLQSGCTATLQRMGRLYTAPEYAALVKRLREAFPDAAFTTDVMVGFPGETQEEFSESLRFCEQLGFAKMHVFAYSRRPGTPADRMPGQVPAEEKSRRSLQMREAADRARARFLAAQQGKVCSVLFEQRAADGSFTGHSENYTPVRVKMKEELGGQIRFVRLTGLLGEGMSGELEP